MSCLWWNVIQLVRSDVCSVAVHGAVYFLILLYCLPRLPTTFSSHFSTKLSPLAVSVYRSLDLLSPHPPHHFIVSLFLKHFYRFILSISTLLFSPLLLLCFLLIVLFFLHLYCFCSSLLLLIIPPFFHFSLLYFPHFLTFSFPRLSSFPHFSSFSFSLSSITSLSRPLVTPDSFY